MTNLTEVSRVHTFVLPSSVFSGFVIFKIPFLSGLAWYFVTIPLHEFGHAFAAWFGSRFALPIGAFIPMAGITFMGTEASIVWGGLYLALTGWLTRWGWKEKSGAVLGLALLLFLLWVRWTVFSDLGEWRRFVAWAGIGGEFFLSSALLVLSFYELPEITHWLFFRFFAVIYGGIGFGLSAARWISIYSGTEKMPSGSFLSGKGDARGDIEQLINVYGSSEPQIIRSYLLLATVCALILSVHFVLIFSKRRLSQSFISRPDG